MTWTDGIALAALLVVVVGTTIALRQLREATRARHLEAMLRVYEIYASDEARAARRFIYTELLSPPEALTPPERLAVEKVCVSLDNVGLLVVRGLVPAEEVLSGHADMVARAWSRLEPYVAHHRAATGSSRHVEHFERLSALARWHIERRDGKGPEPGMNSQIWR